MRLGSLSAFHPTGPAGGSTLEYSIHNSGDGICSEECCSGTCVLLVSSGQTAEALWAAVE